MIDVSMRQLRMLLEVANRGTIAAAAQSLGYTPSAVSQQLAGLERSTGVAVLERVGRNVRLTDAGRELVGHARDLLSGMEAAQVALERVNGEARGTLVLAIYESVTTTLVMPLLTRLANRYPNLHLRTRQVYEEEIDDLATGEIDLAFTKDYPHDPVPPRPDIVRHPVLEDRFNVVVPADDPLEGPVVALAELADRPFIATAPWIDCGRWLATASRHAGFEPDIVHQLDDFWMMLHLVAAGQGVAFVPDLGLLNPPPGVRVLQLDPPLTRTIELAYRTVSAERPSIAAVRMTLDEIVNEINVGCRPASNPPPRQLAT